jgi:hypothetical protein
MDFKWLMQVSALFFSVRRNNSLQQKLIVAEVIRKPALLTEHEGSLL